MLTKFVLKCVNLCLPLSDLHFCIICSFISNKINVKQAEENDSRQQEGAQDNVNDSLQDVTKTLQVNENVNVYLH